MASRTTCDCRTATGSRFRSASSNAVRGDHPMRNAIRFESLEAGALPGILRRGARTILVWMGLFVVLAVGLNLFMPPVYRATVRLEIRKAPDRSPLTGQSIASPGYQ